MMPRSYDPPSPPAGYDPPYLFNYPKLGLMASSFVLFILLVPLLGQLTWRLQGRPTASSFTFASGWQGIVFILLLFLILPGTIIVHELLHGLAYRLLGYRVSYGFYWKLGAYAAAFGQFQQRDHVVIDALAPSLVLSLGMIPFLAASNGMIVTFAFLVVLINTTGAVGDIYLVWKLLHLPRRTLTYDADVHHMWVYESERTESS